ncbi:hypothetical protein [Lactococcus protaetiae]|uniref:Adenylate kinase n=1 Tax=Lactococcus protaetiae TaxID=2592653 RepID=A0A514Z8X3_9LACT|nr:hypothetical protein [Lactococcus protaetiae]QDK71038.1 hypothetical protein FLP15_07540 [Lactococcus protaetiae]
MINKISCFGNTASGKSYLAEKLAQELDLPHFSLDKLYWQENWTHCTKAEFLAEQRKILAGEYWVLDGTFAECGLAERIERSELVVLLDSKPLDCFTKQVAAKSPTS